jgi:hypothetical protein
MNRISRFAAIAVVCLAAGCASQVTRVGAPETPKQSMRAVETLSVEMGPNAKAQLADNLAFDVAAMESVLRRMLQAKGLLASDGDVRLKVVVDDIRVRSTFSAMMFGIMAGTDQVNGTASLRGRNDQPLEEMKINTSYGLGGFAGGQDSMRMNWLYEEFSKKLAEELVARRDGAR